MASAKVSPLAAHTRSPQDVVRFGPTESAIRPASGRLSNVAMYCTLMANPARSGLYPSCRWTKCGTTANCSPIVK